MRRRICITAIAALVVLSGCGALSGSTDTTVTETATDRTTGTPTPTKLPTATPEPTDSATSEPTPEPTDTPTTESTSTPTPTPTPTAESAEKITPNPTLDPVSSMSPLPPGVDASGKLTNATALVRSYYEQFRGQGYDYEMRIRNSTGPDTDVTIKNDTSQALYRVARSDRPGPTTYFLGNEQAGKRNGTSGEITYATGDTRLRTEAGFIGFYLIAGTQYVRIAEWHATGVKTVDGEKRLVMRANSLNRSRTGSQFGPDTGRVTGVDGRMEVSADGLIHEANVTLTVTGENGDTRTLGVRFTTSVADVEVEPPSWLDRPPQVTGGAASEGKLLVLEHTGGAAIPAGTNITVGGTFRTLGNVTADERIEPGQAFFVYKTETSGEQTLHLSIGERPSLPDDATAFSVGQQVVSADLGDLAFEAAIRIEPET